MGNTIANGLGLGQLKSTIYNSFLKLSGLSFHRLAYLWSSDQNGAIHRNHLVFVFSSLYLCWSEQDRHLGKSFTPSFNASAGALKFQCSLQQVHFWWNSLYEFLRGLNVLSSGQKILLELYESYQYSRIIQQDIDILVCGLMLTWSCLSSFVFSVAARSWRQWTTKCFCVKPCNRSMNLNMNYLVIDCILFFEYSGVQTPTEPYCVFDSALKVRLKQIWMSFQTPGP